MGTPAQSLWLNRFLDRWSWTSRQKTHHLEQHYEGVLGTDLHLHIVASSAKDARFAETQMLLEMERLENIYSRFLADSELNLWQASTGPWLEVSEDLLWLLSEALFWMEVTSKAFHPGVDALTQLWKTAAQQGRPPEPSAMQEILNALQQPMWEVEGHQARKLSHLPLNFNGFAKGRIVDLACEKAFQSPHVESVLVNIGGDLRHLGHRGVQVDVAHPFAQADNLPPFCRLKLQGQGFATSGNTHRGFQVGEVWHSHLIHPTSGWPVSKVVGVSVLAPDSATADVLATAFSVLPVNESLSLADQLPGVGCLLVHEDQQAFSNALWKQHVLPDP